MVQRSHTDGICPVHIPDPVNLALSFAAHLEIRVVVAIARADGFGVFLWGLIRFDRGEILFGKSDTGDFQHQILCI